MRWCKPEHDLEGHEHADASYQAHLSLMSLTGVGAWLTAAPADEGCELDSALFRLSLRRRLQLRVQSVDTFCPLCGGTMDSYGDHALVCPCHGDRTVRHNALRDATHAEASAANLNPERKKAGLLPARPQEDGVHRDANNTHADPHTPTMRTHTRPWRHCRAWCVCAATCTTDGCVPTTGEHANNIAHKRWPPPRP